MVFYEAFEIPPNTCVAIVGAGGKTTLMYRLAAEIAAEAARTNRAILITSTTKIFWPETEEAEAVILTDDLEEAQSRIRRTARKDLRIVLAAGSHADPRYETKKLDGIPPDWADPLLEMEEVGWLLVEADGSQRRPVKAPGDGEPVWPNPVDWAVGVLGLSALGRPNHRDRVFRPDRVTRVTETPEGAALDLSAYLALMANPDGIFRGAPKESHLIGFLNQTDACDQVVDHEAIGYILNDKIDAGRMETIFSGSLLETKIQRVWTRNG